MTDFYLYFNVKTMSIIYKNIVYSMQILVHIFMFHKIIVRSKIMYRSDIREDSELKYERRSIPLNKKTHLHFIKIIEYCRLAPAL